VFEGDFFADALFFLAGESTNGLKGDFLPALRVFLAGESTEVATGLFREGDFLKGDFFVSLIRAGECIILGLSGRECSCSRMGLLG
jgi:hypothetical protein